MNAASPNPAATKFPRCSAAPAPRHTRRSPPPRVTPSDPRVETISESTNPAESTDTAAHRTSKNADAHLRAALCALEFRRPLLHCHDRLDHARLWFGKRLKLPDQIREVGLVRDP